MEVQQNGRSLIIQSIVNLLCYIAIVLLRFFVKQFFGFQNCPTRLTYFFIVSKRRQLAERISAIVAMNF